MLQQKDRNPKFENNVRLLQNVVSSEPSLLVVRSSQKKNLSKERLNEIDKELLECAKICKTLDEKMEEIKTGN